MDIEGRKKQVKKKNKNKRTKTKEQKQKKTFYCIPMLKGRGNKSLQK